MDISGINSGMVRSSLESAKREAGNNEFERLLKKAYNEKDEKQLKKVCKDFEQIFTGIMYKEMRATVPKSDLEESDFAKDTFQDMFDQKICEEAAKGQGLGLADMLYKSLSRNMESTYKVDGGKGNEKKTDIQHKKNP